MLTNDGINLAVARARDLSKRSSLCWGLFDSNGNTLQFDACMVGLLNEKLELDIEAFSYCANELFVSCEPVSPVVDVGRVIEAIENSNLTKLTIGKQLDEAACDPIWRKWIYQWRGEVCYLAFNPIVDSLCMSIELLKMQRRPYVTLASAANFSGVSLPLDVFTRDFDFLNHLSILVQQSRVLIYSESQRGIVEQLPKNNFAGERIELYELFDCNHIEPIFEHCISELRCSVLILGDLSLMQHLAVHNRVDEIVHHVTNLASLGFVYMDPKGVDKSTNPRSLDSWKILSSSFVGHCSRIVLGKPLDNVHAAENLRGSLN